MSAGTKRVIRRVVTAIILAALLAAGTFAYVNRQQILDHFEAQRFTPTQQIIELTETLQLTESGHRIFFASHPTVDGSQHFNEQCAQVDHSEGGHVLGCFSDSRIHLFNVQDERLSGIVEVTAAHELLHATFSRLNSTEKTELAEKLTSLYEELVVTNPELEQRMSVYSHLTKIRFANELHSVLGTEVRDLPEWLEQHYAAWFNDRSAILDLFESYHSVFEELRERADQLDSEMTALRKDVEARSAVYDAAVTQFNIEWAEFVRRNDAYEFSSNPAEFYRIRADLYSRRDALNADLARLNDDIERYEGMRAELIELSELNTELEEHLDSSLAPPVTVPDA